MTYKKVICKRNKIVLKVKFKHLSLPFNKGFIVAIGLRKSVDI